MICYDKEIARLQEEYNKYYSFRASLYDDLQKGVISRTEFEEFREIYGNKCKELELLVDNQKKIIRQMFEEGVSAAVQIEEWKKSLELKELDRLLLAMTVDRIYVYENKKIEIFLRYQDVFEKMKVIKHFFSDKQEESNKEGE